MLIGDMFDAVHVHARKEAQTPVADENMHDWQCCLNAEEIAPGAQEGRIERMARQATIQYAEQ